MTGRFLPALLAVALSFALAAPAHAQDGFDAKEKAEIEKIIHDYLVENPEVLVKAFDTLEYWSQAMSWRARGMPQDMTEIHTKYD